MKKTTKANGATLKAIGYVRVSTREQAEHGVSLEAQEEKIRAYATLKGLELVELVREEGESGGTPLADRPEGARVLAAVKAGTVGSVVACKLDRCFRDAVDALSVTRAWDEAGAALHVIDMGGNAIDTHSAAGRFMLTVLAGAAEMEKNQISERTAAALQHLKLKGVQLGGAALGWERTEATDSEERRVVRELPEEVATVARIQVLRAEGQSLRSIAETLTTEGRKTKKGGKWAAETVRLVLSRVA